MNKIIAAFLTVFTACFGNAQSNTPCGGSGAPNIAVNSSCVYTSGSTAGLTAQTTAANFGSPGCGSMGPDGWFSFTAPASGSVSIETVAGSITDGVMAVYESDCSTGYTELACDDDSGTGFMPLISPLNGLTPGVTYYIRFWEYAGGTGTFDICVTEIAAPPPPPGNVGCGGMEPICTDVGLSFTAEAGGVTDVWVEQPGNNYDCLGTSPDPTWYYFEIGTSGNIDMNLSAPSDIDFVIWGPFTDLSAAQSACGNLGNAPTSTNGAVVDCSFSFTNNEFPSITGAVVGEVYVMVITNFAGVVQPVSLTQVGGTGATNCSIVTCPGADAGSW